MVHIHDRPADRKPVAGASVAGEAALKNLVQKLRAYAVSMVCHRDHGLSVVRSTGEQDHTVFRVPVGIDNQIVQYLQDQVSVTVQKITLSALYVNPVSALLTDGLAEQGRIPQD